jgi:cation diffusion facilitator family transporter
LKTTQRLALLSVFSSGFLSLINIVLGLRGGSTSVTAAGVEFLGDVLASSIVLLGAFLASKPPDENHPYGHGRIEILAGLWVGVILSMGGVGICFRAMQKITEMHAPPARYTIYPLAIAIFVKTFLTTIKFHYGRKLRSGSLIADAWNDAVDIISAIAGIVALTLTLSDPARFLAADHYGGFAIGIIVIFTGIHVIRDSSLQLIDTMPDPGLLLDIRNAALGVAGVWGLHRVRARKTGLQYHVDLHVEVDPALSVYDAHIISGTVRSRIKAQIEAVADVLIHIEPSEKK